MSRRLPLIPTIVVLAAFGTMIGLGVWQLQRAEWKAGLLERYEAALADSDPVVWPTGEEQVEQSLYRRSEVDCVAVHALTARAGRNAADEPGQAVHADCETGTGARIDVVLGWSREPPTNTVWPGGEVRGTIAPGPRLVADPPLGGFEANSRPDPADIPDNHIAYAIQWFFFALTALVIYALALRKRWRGQGKV